MIPQGVVLPHLSITRHARLDPLTLREGLPEAGHEAEGRGGGWEAVVLVSEEGDDDFGGCGGVVEGDAARE